MANYQRCRIRVYPLEGKLELEKLTAKVKELQAENNIYEAIEVYLEADLAFAEIRFTARRYPSMLTEIFELEQYDLWIINSDEGGSSDYLRFETNQNRLFEGFLEKAVYTFEEFVLVGKRDEIQRNLATILGPRINYLSISSVDTGLKVPLKCQYTANNFFYNSEKEGIIKMLPFKEEIKGSFKNETGEFWDMLFHLDGIKFKENFYRIFQEAPNGINPFPYLEKVELYYNQRLSNQIEWSDKAKMKYWEHRSEDGFWNCGNAKFYAYELLRNA